jgi:hypothetical protein
LVHQSKPSVLGASDAHPMAWAFWSCSFTLCQSRTFFPNSPKCLAAWQLLVLSAYSTTINLSPAS